MLKIGLFIHFEDAVNLRRLMIPVAYWGCCTANKSLQADSYQINWDFRILSILSGSKNLRWNSPPGEKLQQTSLGCRSTRIPPLFRLDIWAFDKGTAVAKAKLSDVEARSQQGGGGGNETSWPPHLLSLSNGISYTWYWCPKGDPEHTSIHPNLRGLLGWADMKKGHTQDLICSFLQRRAKAKK